MIEIKNTSDDLGNNRKVITFDGESECEELKLRIPNEYRPLFEALLEAFKQASQGKGKERHSNNAPFTDQPIFEIPRMIPSCGAGFLIGQAIKKAAESALLYVEHGADKACHEIDGAINYLAALKIYMREAEAKLRAGNGCL